jgi:putative sigma-54 modulation protein
MQLIIKGKNMEVTEPLRTYVHRKLGQLDRYLPTIDKVRVELSVENVRSNKDRQVVQVTMHSNSTILRAEERSADMFAAIDAVRDKLRRQIRRYKEKPIRVRERARMAVQAAEPAPEEMAPRIVRTKRFTVQPMTEEDAIEQMELLGHDFFIFFNPSVDSMNVVYRRRDGNYGLLQPEPD